MNLLLMYKSKNKIFTQHIWIESRALPLTWMLQIPKAQFSKHHILFRKHCTLPNQWNKSPWVFYEFKPLLWFTLLSLSMEVPSLIPSCSPTASSGSLMSTVGLRGGWPPHAAASAAEPRAKPEIRNQRGYVLNSRVWPALKAAASIRAPNMSHPCDVWQQRDSIKQQLKRNLLW